MLLAVFHLSTRKFDLKQQTGVVVFVLFLLHVMLYVIRLNKIQDAALIPAIYIYIYIYYFVVY